MNEAVKEKDEEKKIDDTHKRIQIWSMKFFDLTTGGISTVSAHTLPSLYSK